MKGVERLNGRSFFRKNSVFSEINGKEHYIKKYLLIWQHGAKNFA